MSFETYTYYRLYKLANGWMIEFHKSGLTKEALYFKTRKEATVWIDKHDFEDGL